MSFLQEWPRPTKTGHNSQSGCRRKEASAFCCQHATRTNHPRGSAPRAPGRAFLRHGPFSIHKTRRTQTRIPFTWHCPRHSLHASIPSAKTARRIHFWVRRDADPPTKFPRGSAPRAHGRALLRHGPFSIHKKPHKPLSATALIPQHSPIPTAARTRFMTRSETSRAFAAPSARTRSTSPTSAKISSRLTRKGAKYSQIPTKRRFFKSP